jgi:hypothetical protein
LVEPKEGESVDDLSQGMRVDDAFRLLSLFVAKVHFSTSPPVLYGTKYEYCRSVDLHPVYLLNVCDRFESETAHA